MILCPWPLVGVLHLTIDALWDEEGRDAMTSGLLPFVAQVTYVSVASSRPAFLVVGDVLDMFLADHTGASSGVGSPGFVRHCRRSN